MSPTPQAKGSHTRCFVLTMPGLGPLLRKEIAGLEGVRVTGMGNDGRSDVVLCDVQPGREKSLLGLRAAEDVFSEFGRTLRSEGDNPVWIAKRVWRPARVDRAVGLWRTIAARPRRPTARVVARVLQERSFQRTELRRALGVSVERARYGWKPADPADLELWILEYDRGRFIAGVRLTTGEMRRHGGRASERSGALRPAIAAAMVTLAGPPSGERILLDPCCGSGTIPIEAAAAGWNPVGIDIDPSAVRTARRNARRVPIHEGDARALTLSDESVDAVVSNLPFGRQYAMEGDSESWLRDVLSEIARVLRPDGRAVLLTPRIPRSVVPAALRPVDRFPLRLLGTKTTIWTYGRKSDGRPS